MALTDGLVAYYKLDGNSNDVFGNNGTDTSITYNASNGKLIQGAGYGGSSYINVGSTSTFSYIQNTAVFTISFWMKTTSFSTLYYICGNTPTSSEKGFFISKSAAGALALQVFNGSGVVNSLIVYSTVNGVIADNNWHLITYSVNSSTTTISVYVDAVLQTTGSSTGLWNLSTGNSTRTLNLGSINWTTPTTFTFNGALDEFSFWNRALSADEVKDLYLNGNGSQYPFRDKGFFMM